MRSRAGRRSSAVLPRWDHTRTMYSYCSGLAGRVVDSARRLRLTSFNPVQAEAEPSSSAFEHPAQDSRNGGKPANEKFYKVQHRPVVLKSRTDDEHDTKD